MMNLEGGIMHFEGDMMLMGGGGAAFYILMEF